MKNPLNKRLPREFRKDFGKYLVIFLLLVITIGFVSGFLVADGSMIKAYNEGIDKYNTENGHFRTSEKMNDAQIQSVEENGIRIYDNFYLEQDLINGSTMRIFANRDQVNLACLMEGEFPKSSNRQPGHGFGIKSMAAIVTQHGGLYSFETSGNIFTLQLMLPLIAKS